MWTVFYVYVKKMMMGIKRTVQFSNQMVGGRLGKGGGLLSFFELLGWNFQWRPNFGQIFRNGKFGLQLHLGVYPNFYKESIEMGPICQIQETNNNFENLNLVVPTSRVFSFTTLMYETCFNLNSPWEIS